MTRYQTTLSLMFAASLSYPASARDYIDIVGSSTVYPFATVVAEQFGRTTPFKTPKIESTGSGGASNYSVPGSVYSTRTSPMRLDKSRLRKSTTAELGAWTIS